MKFTKDVLEFVPWGQAKGTWGVINELDKVDEFDALVAEMYEGMDYPTEAEINDILAYDWDKVYDLLGIEWNEETKRIEKYYKRY